MSRLAELQQRFGHPRRERLRFELLVMPDHIPGRYRYYPPSWLLLPDPDPLIVKGLMSPEPLQTGDAILLHGWPRLVQRVISRPQPNHPPPAQGWPELHRAIVELGAVTWETTLACHEHHRREQQRQLSKARRAPDRPVFFMI